MPRALIGHQENCISMLYSGTVWRLNKLEPPYSVPVSLKIQYVPTDHAPIYVVLGNADSIAFAYSYSESGCLDTGSLGIRFNRYRFSRYTFIRIRFLDTHSQTVPIYLILQYWYAHIRYQLIGMQYVPICSSDISLLACGMSRYLLWSIALLGMQYVSVLLMRYRLIGMQNTSVSIIRYHLTGMQYIPISFTTYRLSDMQYISATFIMYHLTGM